ncbi:hypothetical protein D1818_21060 [Aquimarina sp. BL5]|uniref:hypothetical protein n=1 Tax=Aquimarina sp. BL5 TaxID=1714860 RepID=UPI000E53C958|nr:hypothetical protein [Aquimarina sp. BL5]AXT53196.1 hypothetical protein D1818_21060 [Aquimarina sp. BL5]RKN02882.1 hypothetical protein D7036_15555 [Aquimarina sp. BL5]
MKTKLITVICAIFTIIACTKDNEINEEVQQKESIVDQMTKLSERFFINDFGKKDTDWKKVAIADVAAGAGESADPSSTVLSVTLVAAAASVKEYNSQQSTLTNIDPNGSTTGQIDPNQTNPYDSYGYWHYSSIDNVLVNPERYLNGEDFDNEQFYEATKEFLSDNNVGDYSDYENFSLDEANEKLMFSSDLLETYGLLGGLEYKFEKGFITELVYEILKPYYKILENSNNIQEFVDYSLQAEELIVNSILERKDKQIVLSTMATARYGMQYWSKEFGEY